MKKLFLSMTMAAVSLLAFANVPKNNSEKMAKNTYTYAANQTLKGMYGSVDNLQWSVAKENLIRADFAIDGEKFSTFFDNEGRHVATTSEKTVDQLPALVRKTVKTKFQGKEVTNMVQYTTDSEEAYFVEVVDHGKTKIFRVGSNGSASRFK